MTRRNQLRTLVAAVLLAFAASAASLPRDRVQTARFKKENPCPVTGLTKGRCEGYQVDHVKPLMLGGKDKPENMQWLTIEAHKAKTKAEIKQCKRKKSCRHRRMKK